MRSGRGPAAVELTPTMPSTTGMRFLSILRWPIHTPRGLASTGWVIRCGWRGVPSPVVGKRRAGVDPAPDRALAVHPERRSVVRVVADRDLRFHAYDLVLPTPQLEDLWKEADLEPTAIFLGPGAAPKRLRRRRPRESGRRGRHCGTHQLRRRTAGGAAADVSQVGPKLGASVQSLGHLLRQSGLGIA